MSTHTRSSSPSVSSVDPDVRPRSDLLPTGLFTWTVSTGSWRWSPETFTLFGYQPDTIDPTTELVLGHACADAGSIVDDIIAACRRGAARFSSYRPIVTTRGRTAVLLATGTIARDDHHHLTVDGQLIDLTTHHRRAGSDAVRAATRARDGISQAVGVIMATHHLDATAAFDLLVQHSQTHNTKLAVIAHRLIDQFPRLPVTDTRRADVDHLLDAAARPDTPSDRTDDTVPSPETTPRRSTPAGDPEGRR